MIGIASCYYNRNYGSMLQAYATQEIVKKLGYEAITIQCLSPINYMTQSKVRYYIHKLSNPDIIAAKIRQKAGDKKKSNNDKLKYNIQIRNRMFDSFYKKHIRLSQIMRSRSELSEFCNQLEAVIVGSDMLWHPINNEHNYYTLTFVPDSINKISYATSFGTTIIPKYQQKFVKYFISRFQSISVREQSGLDVIQNLGIEKPAEVVLDPTLLFSKAEWSHLIDESNVLDEKYILCYFLGVNSEHREIATKLSKILGLKIVVLPHLDEFVEFDERFGDIHLYNIGPSEFVNLIRNAEYVLTDSFHGTCFSIINHKKFLTFNRFLSNNSQSTNTRIDSLLNITGLLHHRVSNYSDKLVQVLTNDENYDKVDYLLENERNKSIAFLSNALRR